MPEIISHSDWKPSHNPWVVAMVVTLGTFMQVLDSSIANVALPHIAGTLGATYNESTWILTSYLVSSAIVLPISGWLATVLGRKRFYLFCIGLFTASSFICGISDSLPMLIIARVLQGAGGGGLQPSEQAILADTFSVEKRGMAFSIYGMAVVVAPAIGPTLGGWITDNFSWHWIFFINIPVGIISFALATRFVEDPPWLKQERRAGIGIDYIGLALIVIGVATFQMVLDKGQQKDWFSDPLITTMFCIGVPALVAFFLWEWYHPDPIVDVRLLKNRNFGTAVFFSFILGIVLFGSTVLIPQFLQTSLGYTAELAGLALSPGGIVLMFLMPVAGRLTQTKIDPRLLIAFGFLATAVTLHLFTVVYLGITFTTIVILRMLQVVGMPFIFIPISILNYVGVPREKNNQVSGISNFSRNMGGAIGTSLIETFLARQNQMHQVALTAHTTHANPHFEHLLQMLQGAYFAYGYGPAEAAQKALATVYQMIYAQASALSFENSFWMMSVIVLCLVPLPFIMRRPRPGEQQPRAAH
ncbi:MAG TPA: DHA2 family efflux MFS transporter permease subunit [Bryobacteraceae bacterium]